MNSRPPSRRRAAYATLVGGYVNIGVVIVQGVLLVPLYLYYIGPQLFGAWLGSGDIIGWLAILDMGLASLMIQRMGAAYGQGNGELVSEYLATGLLTQLFMVLLLFAGTVVISRWVPGSMGIKGVDADILSGSIILAGAASGLNILNNGVAGFAIALQRTVFMSVATLVGALMGIGVTVTLLLQGWGLWAIPLGWVVRDGSVLVGNTVYAVVLHRTEIRTPLRMSRKVLRDFAIVSPSMFAAKLGGAIAGRSEAALIAIFIKPELATVYVLTKRAADIVRLVLDRFGAATFGGFSHLIGTGHKTRAASIYHEIMGLYAPIAALTISLYIALNQTFMNIWVGPEMFGGQVLTALIGLSVIAAAASSLINYLYGATGQIVRSSLIVLAEGFLRLGLMALLLYWQGLAGLPVATILTATTAGLITWRWTRRELEVAPGLRLAPKGWPALGWLLVLGGLVGTYIWAVTWWGLMLAGVVWGAAFLGITLLINLPLRSYLQSIPRRAMKVSI